MDGDTENQELREAVADLAKTLSNTVKELSLARSNFRGLIAAIKTTVVEPGLFDSACLQQFQADYSAQQGPDSDTSRICRGLLEIEKKFRRGV